MKILAFSDVHCDLEACARIVQAAEDADLVIGAGDFARAHRGLEETMQALEPIAAKAIHVPGNNETEAALRAATSARVLHGQAVEFGGLRIGGLGGAVPPMPHPGWHSFDIPEKEAAQMLAAIGRADILISHSPPRDSVDMLGPNGLFGMHGAIGSTAVRAWVEEAQPRLVLCGHVHDSWGRRARIGQSEIANLGPTINWFELEEKDGAH